MTVNKDWDDNGNCIRCTHPLNMHAPRNFCNLETGAMCFFLPNGDLKPKILKWLRPILIAGIAEFRKSNEDNSLIERTELAKAILAHHAEIAEIESKHGNRVMKLNAKIVSQQEEWTTYHDTEIYKRERRIDMRDQDVQKLKLHLSNLHSAQADETAYLHREQERILVELEAIQQKELKKLLEEIDVLRERCVHTQQPPKIPMSEKLVHQKKMTGRLITMRDLAALPHTSKRRPLPGMPKPHLHLVVSK